MGFSKLRLYSWVTALLICLSTENLSCNAGITSSYIRPDFFSSDLPLDSPYFAVPPGDNAPQQVHITQGDSDGKAVTISWITPKAAGSSQVLYGTSPNAYTQSSNSTVSTYSYFTYTSGYIHHCLIKGLQPATTYYYKLGDDTYSREFSFVTPPGVGPNVPYTFGILGDLGQTSDTVTTLQHYLKSQGQAVLYLGDLSYADTYIFPLHDQRRWDAWGNLVENSTAYQSWIWSAGNHEVDTTIGEDEPFKPFLNRYWTPYASSASTSQLWYSVQRASAYIIVLSSYSDYSADSPQWIWLEKELAKVDRTTTPWLIVVMHCPLYNSNESHQGEGDAMRALFEQWFIQYKVDIVLAGHVHAYERTNRISSVGCSSACTPVPNDSAPIYLNIGDGGNREGLSTSYINPQPAYSAYREASFGHAILDIKNRTHAFWSWHRNQDGEPVIGDSLWITNRVIKS
ncbi:hypothetical protein O6H91_06G122600 [Diphasiastrum complanatum]|uniref:Uncharacterized protein n=3 Tax=Diphasiastrum complanatum TaxID=34168 RepID=A0ACC2DIS5_DIPCM|nr:hypothetical protein O6H91_06G121900 [Diphasiastrum complanatum]KAJ7554017.1 hypothetical protein O6H91_06G122600 [Diphasiastrum complanatum]KAJ7554018.1 hypothetical protein O6H91_06G122600 [Diphasiastrum complanatum]